MQYEVSAIPVFQGAGVDFVRHICYYNDEQIRQLHNSTDVENCQQKNQVKFIKLLWRLIMSIYFYEIFNELCKSTSEIPSQVAQDCNFHRITISAWKSNHTAPSNKILAELSNHFCVPVSFLSQSPPFNDWEEIDKDYRAFLYATGISQQYLTNEYQFDFSSEKYNLKRLVLFIDTFIASAKYENGKCLILLNIALKLCQKYNISLDWLTGRSETIYRDN